MISEEIFKKNMNTIYSNILSNKILHNFTIVGITKKQSPQYYKYFINNGLFHVGENRVEELNIKLEELNKPVDISQLKLHFIGSLQSRQIKYLPKNLYSIDSLCSQKHFSLLEQHYREETSDTLTKITEILLQINVTEEEQKYGLLYNNLDNIFSLAEKVEESSYFRLSGIMGMGPTPTSLLDRKSIAYEKETRIAFRRAYTVREKLSDYLRRDLFRLSCGMSNDYLWALEEGATEIRLGRVLFEES